MGIWKERTHTHTNHPTISDAHDVGGRAQLSEEQGVRWGLETSDLIQGSSCLHYLWAPPLPQLAPRQPRLLRAKMIDERRPLPPFPPYKWV